MKKWIRARFRRHPRICITLVTLVTLLITPIILFAANGLFLANGESPLVGTTSHSPKQNHAEPIEVKILAYNIAKGFVSKGGLKFDSEEKVRARLEKMIAVINREKPDFVFLSEAVFECSPCDVNQVVEIAKGTGMHSWTFGENYNFGLPFYRIVGGNAILSRYPLEAVANPSLAGRKPFWVTHNNRRVLWAAVTIQDQCVLLASLHTDSFSRKNNAKQMQEILEFSRGQPTILAGDFNAKPDSQSLKLVRQSGRFTGAIEGELTFPANKPDRRIDYIFAPKSWELIEHRVLEDVISDHRPVVSRFRISFSHGD